jgi:hypothetical protein
MFTLIDLLTGCQIPLTFSANPQSLNFSAASFAAASAACRALFTTAGIISKKITISGVTISLKWLCSNAGFACPSNTAVLVESLFSGVLSFELGESC